MDGIAFGVIITGASVWACSVLGVLALGIAARRNDPRVVVDDPWERPEIAARWREYEHPVDSTEKAVPAQSTGRSTGRSHPRSAA
jgi:hypothetical protein